MIDGHMHLEYGDLNKEYVLKFVDAAVKKGLTKIQILDHTHRFKEFEEIYTELKEEPLQKKWLENKAMKFKDTLDDYDKLIEEVKALDLPIEVTFGLADMNELIRDFQPSVEIKTGNEKNAICEWSLTEEMERSLK